MCPRKEPASRLALAIDATANILWQRVSEFRRESDIQALQTHGDIQGLSPTAKNTRFYSRFMPLLANLAVTFGETYRRLFKLAIANPRDCGLDPHDWVWGQLQASTSVAFEWICDWWVLACEGENRYVRRAASTPFVPGETVSAQISTTVYPWPQSDVWCAPCWTFLIFPPAILRMKTKHVPDTNSDLKLSPAHTRLILKAMRRVFRMKLAMEIDQARNEEMAVAGAIPVQTPVTARRGPNKRKGWRQKVKLHEVIRKILTANPKLEGIEFCGELDKRHAPPLYDWTKKDKEDDEDEEWRAGLTWKEAWEIPSLKSKIRRVRQEAMKNG